MNGSSLIKDLLDGSDKNSEGPERLVQLYMDLSKEPEQLYTPTTSRPPSTPIDNEQDKGEEFRLFNQCYKIKVDKQGPIHQMMEQRAKYKQLRKGFLQQQGTELKNSLGGIPK